ncbi:ligand-binding sensor domain-containing protein [Spiroplasma chrysopicola]|uniref:Uncharacterized protein n=1 Tax=Spiroplasma chrysopicola DF-1 TaxID=1276227 RepID=R4UBD6_9MOLU|nr:hypothetical protein [Spiroplasma chrysopicola]AGM25199.1 hypothetical protein SCHRY_v1c06230 [Spiroplasma chrysopicola DF-1]
MNIIHLQKLVFFAKRITLATDVLKTNFPVSLDIANEDEIKKEVKAKNGALLEEYVKVKNIVSDGQFVTADLVSWENNGNSFYLENDSLPLYFSKTGKKLLSEVITENNIGDIKINNSDNILAAVQTKNLDVIKEEIIVVENSITDRQAVLKVKENSEKYIANTEVTVQYRIFNPNVGTYKRVAEGIGNKETAMIETTEGLIMAASDTTLYQLDSDANNIRKVELNRKLEGGIRSLIQTREGPIFLGTSKGVIYYLDKDGNIKEQLTQSEEINGGITFMSQLSTGTILLITTTGYIYQLRPDGKKITEISRLPDEGSYSYASLVESKIGDMVLVQSGAGIYQLHIDGTFIKKVVNGLRSLLHITKLKNGIILGFVNVTNGNPKVFQIDMYGNAIAEVPKPNLWSAVYTSVVTTKGRLFVGTWGGIIFELNTI